jgi:hypothetical protein
MPMPKERKKVMKKQRRSKNKNLWEKHDPCSLNGVSKLAGLQFIFGSSGPDDLKKESS